MRRSLAQQYTNEELREFFARTPMIEPFSSNLDSIFAMNIDVNKLFVLAQVRGGRRTPRARATARWLGLCSKRFQGYGRQHGSHVDKRARVRDGEGCGVRRPAYV